MSHTNALVGNAIKIFKARIQALSNARYITNKELKIAEFDIEQKSEAFEEQSFTQEGSREPERR